MSTNNPLIHAKRTEDFMNLQIWRKASDYAACYRMLDHSAAVAEVIDELLKN